jgi:hypothetical protein
MVTGRLNIAATKLLGWTACWIDTSNFGMPPAAFGRG